MVDTGSGEVGGRFATVSVPLELLAAHVPPAAHAILKGAPTVHRYFVCKRAHNVPNVSL
jgi:hypothetical protein